MAIVVIGKGEERGPVAAKAHAVGEDLRRAGLSVIVDDDESKGPGFKYFEYELAGVCLRLELGPKDLAKGACVLVRRDDRTKETVPLEQAVSVAKAKLDAMQKALFEKARRTFRDANTFAVASMEEMKARAGRRVPPRPVVRGQRLRGAGEGGDRWRHLAQPAVRSRSPSRGSAWSAAIPAQG